MFFFFTIICFQNIYGIFLHRLQLSGAEKEAAKKEALELSLKYSFVTPLTSMVVTKPPGESTDVLHKPKEGEMKPATGFGGSSLSFGGFLHRGVGSSPVSGGYSRGGGGGGGGGYGGGYGERAAGEK